MVNYIFDMWFFGYLFEYFFLEISVHPSSPLWQLRAVGNRQRHHCSNLGHKRFGWSRLGSDHRSGCPTARIKICSKTRGIRSLCDRMFNSRLHWCWEMFACSWLNFFWSYLLIFLVPGWNDHCHLKSSAENCKRNHCWLLTLDCWISILPSTETHDKDSVQRFSPKIQTSQDYLPVFGQQAFTGGQVWATET